MARTYGLAADRVRAFEVVTGDGVFRRVTPTEHPDLFFALRGGKGAAGHRDRGRVRPGPPADVLRRRGLLRRRRRRRASSTGGGAGRTTLPEQATTSFVLFQLPPLPEVPPPLAGRMTLGVRFVWTGEPRGGRPAAGRDPRRRAGHPRRRRAEALHRDRLGARRPGRPDAGRRPGDPAERVPGRGGRAAARASPAPDRAPRRSWSRCGSWAAPTPGRAAHPNAFSHRAAKFSVLAVGMRAEATAAGGLRTPSWLFAALADWDTGGVWPNFGTAARRRSARRAYDEPTRSRGSRRGHRDLRPGRACCRRGRTPGPELVPACPDRPSGCRRGQESSAAVISRRSAPGRCPVGEHLHRQPLALAEQAECDVSPSGEARHQSRAPRARSTLHDRCASRRPGRPSPAPTPASTAPGRRPSIPKLRRIAQS